LILGLPEPRRVHEFGVVINASAETDIERLRQNTLGHHRKLRVLSAGEQQQHVLLLMDRRLRLERWTEITRRQNRDQKAEKCDATTCGHDTYQAEVGWIIYCRRDV